MVHPGVVEAVEAEAVGENLFCYIVQYMNKSFDRIPVTTGDILHEIFDQSSEGFQVIDRDWRYLFVNATVARQGKRQPEELIGHTMMEMYPGIENTPLFVQLRRSMDERVSIRMVNEFEYPDKSKGWFQLFIHPWENGIMIFSVEITERKRAEQALIKKTEELHRAVSHVPEAKEKIEELKKAIQQLNQETLIVS